jgi:outer membrane protein
MNVPKIVAVALAVAGSFAMLTALPVRADDSADAGNSWLVRVRAISLEPANQSSANPTLSVPANAITINSKIIPDLDLSYFFSDPHLAAELVLTYPQLQSVYFQGGLIGTFDHLPPSLMAQYHLSPGAAFQPYVGVGVNETLIRNASLNVGGVGALHLDSSSTGIAYQVGADLKSGQRHVINIDAKYINIASGVYAGSTKVSTATINPWLFGVGYGFRI